MKRPYLIILLLLILSSSIFAAGKIYWQENGVLVTGIDGMGIGDLVTDMKGGAIIITGDLDSVYAIRIDKNGNLPWGIKGKTVDTTAQGSFQRYTIGCSDGQGGAIILWSRFFPWGYELYCQKIDSNGNKLWGNDAIKITLSDSSQYSHVIANDGAGGAIIAWQQFQMLQHDIYAQRIDSNGVRQWGDYGVTVCSADSTQESIGITCDNLGKSVIAWADYRTSAPHIYVDRLDGNGTSLWQINGKIVCATDSGQGLPGYGNVMTMATDTTVIIAWHDARNGTGNIDVYAQCFNVNGNALWAAQGVVACDTIGRQGSAQIVPDGRGGMVSCWIDRRNSFMNIYAQRVNKDGQITWLNQGVPVCCSDSVYWYHRMVSDNNGGAIICWQDNRNGNADIYAQHVDSLGNVKWQPNGMPACTVIRTQERPHIIQSDSGTAIIAWPDYRDNYARAYAQRVGDDPNGAEGTPNSELQIINYKLNQNYPNPFNRFTVLSYQLPVAGKVSLKVYNIAGQLVRILDEGYRITGFYSVKWDGRDDQGISASNGVYFYRLTINDQSITQKLTLIK